MCCPGLHEMENQRGGAAADVLSCRPSREKMDEKHIGRYALPLGEGS